LSDARKLRDKAIDQLKDGLDPARSKKLEKIQSINTFELVAKEWFEKEREKWSDRATYS
jgi:hypothetical protein